MFTTFLTRSLAAGVPPLTFSGRYGLWTRTSFITTITVLSHRTGSLSMKRNKNNQQMLNAIWARYNSSYMNFYWIGQAQHDIHLKMNVFQVNIYIDWKQIRRTNLHRISRKHKSFSITWEKWKYALLSLDKNQTPTSVRTGKNKHMQHYQFHHFGYF